MKKKNIRDEIVEQRRARLAETGFSEGVSLPDRREAPIVPFLGSNGLICEVKRRSPSRGPIAEGLDAVRQAGIYAQAGAGNLSVLTVPEGFGGSLGDLYDVKKAHPGLAVLRKDFLFAVEDIDASWRAGADAVLLIAGMLDAERLGAMYARAKQLGLGVLVEVHDKNDVEKARRFKPDVVGINSRDLETFVIDPLLPLMVRRQIDWKCRVVYESGIYHPEQAEFAFSSGFDGLLVGEGVVRNPSLASGILQAMKTARPRTFWPRLAELLAGRGQLPLVKICGLTREQDVRLAVELGASLLGFVFWPGSKRQALPQLLRSLTDVKIPKIAVVVNPAGAASLQPEVTEMLEAGLVDAVQMHGDETPDDCARLWPDYYKAVRPAGIDDIAAAGAFRCPRTLIDACADAPGGTGKTVSEPVLAAWKKPLWLAGGVTPDAIDTVVMRWRPELVDLASGIESEPGIKDSGAMRKLFQRLDAVKDVPIKEGE